MNFHKALIYKLEESAGVGAIVDDRIYPLRASPQTQSRPYLTYEIEGSANTYHQGGNSALYQRTFGITAWAPRYDDAVSAIGAVKTEIDAFRGPMGEIGEQVNVRRMHMEGEDDENQQSMGDGSGRLLFGRTIDYVCDYQAI